jgi:hypothetical protein
MMAQLQKDISTTLQSYVGMPLAPTTKEMIENSLRSHIAAMGFDPGLFDIELK